MKNTNFEIEIEKSSSSFEPNILDNKEENNYSDINYITRSSNKSRNIKKNYKNKKEQNKKNKTDINDQKDKKLNIFTFKTLENKTKSDLISMLSDEITVLTKKYISLSCDKIRKRTILMEELIPLTKRKFHKKSFDFSQIININEKKPKKDLSSKKITTLEINGNTEIISNAKIRKISENSENSENNEINKDKKCTNINYVLNLNVENNIQDLIDKIKSMPNVEKNDSINLYEKNDISIYQQGNWTKKFQLDSIEEVYEEENDSKTKSRNNTDITNDAYSKGINYDNFNKYNITFSNEKEIKNNNINTTSMSTKFGTGSIKTNNIFDISSGEEDNYERNTDINYIENNNLEIDNENKTYTDIDHETERTYLLKPIKPNENENSISFMNESDINKLLFYSPSKVKINLIEDNNYGNNNYIKDNDKLNNSALNKRLSEPFDEFFINIPHINNNFTLKDINCDKQNYKNKAYRKKRVIKSSHYNPYILNNLISPKNISKPCNKIKEIKLSLNKNLKKFHNDNQKIKHLNRELFEFNKESINNISLIKERDCIQIFEIPLSNIKNILIDINLSIKEIENLRINKNNKNKIEENSNISSIIINLDKYPDSLLSKNLIKDKKDKIYKNENNHRSRNKIDQNNSLLNKNSPLLNISSEYTSYEIKQENHKVKKDINKNGKNENNKELNITNNKLIYGDNIQNNNINFAYNTNDENKLYISIQSYEEFINNIINQVIELKNKLLLKSNNHQSKTNKTNKIEYSEIDNLLLELEHKIKILKYNYLCILIQKHFSKTNEEKIKVIINGNIKNKREIFFVFFQNMLTHLTEKLMLDNIEKREKYINKIFQILKNYNTINKFDIKFTKKIYKDENKITPEILETKYNLYNKKYNAEKNNEDIFSANKNNNIIINKKFMVTTFVIIPFLYGISYLINFYNNSYK